MTSSDLSAIASELAAIKLILYVIGALVIVSVVLTCLRSYAHVKQFVRSHLGEMFREDARLLLEKNHLAQLVQLAKQRIKERPNDADGHWYLARALQLQGRSQEALNEFEATRKLAPTWSGDHIDPWVAQIKVPPLQVKGDQVTANSSLNTDARDDAARAG
jgi:cytochrome c-type biogenesis protein CcmH/NrfG